jgi:hypothetical protein
MAEAQIRLVGDFGIDCLLTCSDPAREVIDIASDESDAQASARILQETGGRNESS